jgi:ubiquinone/menaquinone biosynthesis C-methylase UbiE
MKRHVVRGYGPFDRFLAKQRHRIARSLIESTEKKGRVLDIGCGSYPQFLMGVDFAERYGLDKVIKPPVTNETRQNDIHLDHYEIEKAGKIPFDDNFFDVVTMLAVFEHIDPAKLVAIHKEIFRILKPNGMYVMTTPAFWTDRLLRFLAKIGLISKVEINEHKGSYRFSDILHVLLEASFVEYKSRYGYFELFMNLWVTVTK